MLKENEYLRLLGVQDLCCPNIQASYEWELHVTGFCSVLGYYGLDHQEVFMEENGLDQSRD